MVAVKHVSVERVQTWNSAETAPQARPSVSQRQTLPCGYLLSCRPAHEMWLLQEECFPGLILLFLIYFVPSSASCLSSTKCPAFRVMFWPISGPLVNHHMPHKNSSDKKINPKYEHEAKQTCLINLGRGVLWDTIDQVLRLSWKLNKYTKVERQAIFSAGKATLPLCKRQGACLQLLEGIMCCLLHNTIIQLAKMQEQSEKMEFSNIEKETHSVLI